MVEADNGAEAQSIAVRVSSVRAFRPQTIAAGRADRALPADGENGALWFMLSVARFIGWSASLRVLSGVLAMWACAVWGTSPAVGGQPLSAGARPNILFLMIDDLRPEFGHLPGGLAITPNLDALAARSLRFERAYCQVPVCGASRASLMTGLYPTARRFLSFATRADRDAPTAATLPEVLRSGGYTTVSLGKVFHHADDAAERSWSLPPWTPSTDPLTDMLDPESARWHSERGRGPLLEAADVPDDAYWDGQLAARARAELARLSSEGTPFFLACGFFRPHLPFYAPKRYWDLYDRATLPLAANRFVPRDAPAGLRGSAEYRAYHYMGLMENSEAWHRAMRHGYLASLSYVDRLVGTLIDELDRLGRRHDTLVVLVSDHGWHLGEHNFWGKHNTMRGALRVPLWWSHPRVAPGVDGGLVELVDLFPTLARWAGVEPPAGLPGRVLIDPETGARGAARDQVYTRFERADAVLTETMLYARFAAPEPGEMLFDWVADPESNLNVARHPYYAGPLAEMRARLEAMLAATGASPSGLEP